jgi:penicillin-binding protein 1A
LSYAFDSQPVFGKTGTSSGERDAWFTGAAGAIAATVWVGLDDGAPLGFSGAEAALPIWRSFMEEAAGSRASWAPERPESIVERWVEESSGTIVEKGGQGRRRMEFRKRHLPPRKRWWRRLVPPEVIE